MRKIIIILCLFFTAYNSFSQNGIRGFLGPRGYRYHDTLRSLGLQYPLYDLNDSTLAIDPNYFQGYWLKKGNDLYTISRKVGIGTLPQFTAVSLLEVGGVSPNEFYKLYVKGTGYMDSLHLGTGGMINNGSLYAYNANQTFRTFNGSYKIRATILSTSGILNLTPEYTIVDSVNKSLVMQIGNTSAFTKQDSVWNGTTYVGAGSYGLGNAAIANNTGANVWGIGNSSATYNRGIFAVGVGNNSLTYNTGDYVTGIGTYSGYQNTGVSSTFTGTYSAQYNTGGNSGAFGQYSLNSNKGAQSYGFGNFTLQLNTGVGAVGIGYTSGQNNVGVGSVGVGLSTIRYNNWPYKTALGYRSGTFTTVTTQPFASAAVIDSNIVIPSHGFGTVGTYINLKYVLSTGTTVGGLSTNQVYQFYIKSADTLVYGSITSAGSGTYTLGIDADQSYSTSIGYEAVNTRSYQVTLGATTNKEVRAWGNMLMDSAQLLVGAGAGKTIIGDANGRFSWSSSAPAQWGLSGSDAYYTAGNVGIGTTNPSAAALQVVGSTLAGSGSLAGSTASFTDTWNTSGAPIALKVNVTNTASGAAAKLAAFQVASVNVFSFAANGTFVFGTGSASIYPASPSAHTQDVTSGAIRFAYNNAAATVGYSTIFRHASVSATTQASGTNGIALFNDGYAPASGTGIWAALTASGTINQTGGASGITRGLWVNNTLTAVADFRGVDITPSSATAYGIYQSGALTRNYLVGNTGIGATPVTDKLEVTGNISLMTAGNKLKIATGSNASVGTGTLSSGTVTINTTAVTASSIILITPQETGTYNGRLRVSARVAATSFTVTSSDGADTVVFGYQIIN